MKFSCTQENMKRGLGLVSPVAAKSPHLPILSHILIKAEGGLLTLLATDLEIGVKTSVRGKVEADGQFTVPAQVFANYASLVSGERMDVSLAGKELVVASGGQQSKIRGEDPADFPVLPAVDRSRTLTADRGELIRALEHVLVSVASDDSRPELTGVYASLSGSVLTLASTDSYRLAEYRLPVRSSAAELTVIIPGRALHEVHRMMALSEDKDVEMAMGDNQALFKTSSAELVTRLIEGKFPEYRQIIPTSFRTTAAVSVPELTQAIRAASLFAKTGLNDVHLRFDSAQSGVTASAANNQLGENVSKVDGDVTGDANAIVFNYRYLLDGINTVHTPKVKISLIDAGNPALFVPDTGGDQLYILMPIKQ